MSIMSGILRRFVFLPIREHSALKPAIWRSLRLVHTQTVRAVDTSGNAYHREPHKTVYLVGDTQTSGEMEFVRVSTLAKELGLDIIVVDPKKDPPVVKLMDSNKFLMKKRKHEKENKKSSISKEVRLGARTNDHDLSVKEKTIRRLLEKGNKVKVVILYRGPYDYHTHKDQAVPTLMSLAERLERQGKIESEPNMHFMRCVMVLVPTGQRRQT